MKNLKTVIYKIVCNDENVDYNKSHDILNDDLPPFNTSISPHNKGSVFVVDDAKNHFNDEEDDQVINNQNNIPQTISNEWKSKPLGWYLSFIVI